MFHASISESVASPSLTVVASRGKRRPTAAGHQGPRRHTAPQQDSTVEAYRRDVLRFTESYGELPCTADDLLNYIKALCRRVMPATILRRAMAIQDAHVSRGLPVPTDDPRIRQALRSLAAGKLPKELVGNVKDLPAPKRRIQAAPMTRTLLNRMFDAMGSNSLDRRDRALLLLGFVGGLKRGTLCGLDLNDLTFTEDAMLVRIHASGDRSETIAARTIAVSMTRGPLCAASAVQAWIIHNALEAVSGPLFPRFTRSGEPMLSERLDSAYVSQIIKGRLLDAGISDVTAFSGESLRLGHALETTVRRRT